LKKMLEMLLL